MFLKRISLSNIRSYIQQTIEFSSGSTLLGGDIGCGKSSLLLAIEFALFGTSRPDLPAEALLRKGETKGSVELTFHLVEKDITILRNLKKDKDSIKQTAGHLIIDGIKKELTALELKSEIINLLGYPEEFLEKNKNYIFRFTVYTPQEEMKQILYDPPEIRLVVIRKIFNTEKYQLIRQNLQLALRQIRVSLEILQAKSEPIDEKKRKQRELMLDLSNLEQELEKINSPLQNLLQQIAAKTKLIDNLEQMQKQRQQLSLEQSKIAALLEEKEITLSKLSQTNLLLSSQMQALVIPEQLTEPMVAVQIVALERQEQNRISALSALQERMIQLQSRITSKQLELRELNKKISAKVSLEKQILELKQTIAGKQQLEQELQAWPSSLEEINAKVIRSQVVLFNSKELQAKINNLQHCPTCLQQVSIGHRQMIIQAEQQTIDEITKQLQLWQPQRDNLQQQIIHHRSQLALINTAEQNLIFSQSELKLIQQAELTIFGFSSEIDSLIQQKNQAETEILTSGRQLSLKPQITQLQQMRVSLSQKRYLFETKQETEKQITETKNIISLAKEKLSQLVLSLQGNPHSEQEISAQRQEYHQLKEQEKVYSLKLVELQTNKSNLIKIKEELERDLRQLQELELQRLQLQEKYFWLQNYFLPLTITIERQVMATIYHLFNEIFKEWFAILVDDELINARLDDSFTPIIEQNGYEISFFNLSGGEKTAVSLAYRLALNKVINQVMSQIKTKGLLILDEPTDGFSNEQLDQVRTVLDRLQLEQTILVSHESKIESFVENVIKIKKEGYESKIVT